MDHNIFFLGYKNVGAITILKGGIGKQLPRQIKHQNPVCVKVGRNLDRGLL